MSMQVARKIVDELASREFTVNEAIETLKEAEGIVRKLRAGAYEKAGKAALSTLLKAEP